MISVIWAFCFWRKCVISMMKGSSKYVHQRTLVNTQTHISRLRSFQLQQTCKTIVGHKLIFGENPLLIVGQDDLNSEWMPWSYSLELF